MCRDANSLLLICAPCLLCFYFLILFPHFLNNVLALRRVEGLLSVSLATCAVGQQVGKTTPEVHPQLPSWECTLDNGCVQKHTSVVLDSGYRWVHTADGANCKLDGLNATACPDPETCAANCALEGNDYPAWGVFTNGSELTLNLFVNRTTGTSLVSPRVYLSRESDDLQDFLASE